MKRKFIRYGGTKLLVDIPDPPPKPTYTNLWMEYKETLQQVFATKHSFYCWAGQHYSYKPFPTIEQIMADRQEQIGV